MLCLIWCVSIQICLCKSDYISAFIWCLHITDVKQEQSPRERRDVQPLPLPAGLQQHVHHHVLPHRPKQVWFPSRLPLQELHAQLRIGNRPLKTKPTLFIHPNTTVKCFLKHKIQQDFDLLSQRSGWESLRWTLKSLLRSSWPFSSIQICRTVRF